MIFKHDPGADAVYITLREIPYAGGRDLDDSRRVDIGLDQQPRGIELLKVSHGVRIERLPHLAEIADLLRAHGIPVSAPVVR